MNDATVEIPAAEIPAPAAEGTPAKAHGPRKVRTGPVLTKDGIVLRAMKAHNADEFGAAIASFAPSRKLLKEAAKDAGADVPQALTDYLATLGVSGTGAARGRASPKDGEKRTYRVQVLQHKVKDEATGVVTEKGPSAPFLRLPLEILNVKKGDLVVVLFKTDKLVIKVKPAATAADANGPVEVIDAPPAETPQAEAPAAA